MKKLINNLSEVVADMVSGIAAAYPETVRQITKTSVIVSGGGSGHEPAHAGYVGAGMLDAARKQSNGGVDRGNGVLVFYERRQK